MKLPPWQDYVSDAYRFQAAAVRPSARRELNADASALEQQWWRRSNSNGRQDESIESSIVRSEWRFGCERWRRDRAIIDDSTRAAVVKATPTAKMAATAPRARAMATPSSAAVAAMGPIRAAGETRMTMAGLARQPASARVAGPRRTAVV